MCPKIGLSCFCSVLDVRAFIKLNIASESEWESRGEWSGAGVETKYYRWTCVSAPSRSLRIMVVSLSVYYSPTLPCKHGRAFLPSALLCLTPFQLCSNQGTKRRKAPSRVVLASVPLWRSLLGRTLTGKAVSVGVLNPQHFIVCSQSSQHSANVNLAWYKTSKIGNRAAIIYGLC